MAKKKNSLRKPSTASGKPQKKRLTRESTSFLAVRQGCIFVLLAAVAFLIYSNTLQSPFVFDDGPNVQNNRTIRLTRFGWGGIKEAGLESLTAKRPVATISFALNYYFHGYRLWGYHVVNILIHAATGFFLYLFVRTLLSSPSFHPNFKAYRWIAFFAALIWMVHPLHTQSVTYIVQRMNSLASMFYVLSLLFYAKARRSEVKKKKGLFFACSVLSGILALGSKEIAATLPIFIFLYEWYFHQDLNWKWLKRRILPVAGVLLLFAVIGSMFLGAHPIENILAGYDGFDFTPSQRLLTEFRVVIFYFSLLVFPHPSRLNLDHDFALSRSLVDPVTTLLSIGLIAASIGLAIYLAKRKPLYSFCIIWFLGQLVIESSVIGLDILFEHRTYLPSMMVILMAVILINLHLKRKWIQIGILCAVVTAFSVWTYERNLIWGDAVTLWRDCIKKSPHKARPYNNLGSALLPQGKVREAIAQYERAIELDPDNATIHYNLAFAMEKQGRQDSALKYYRLALDLNPFHAKSHLNLGIILHRQGDIEDAIRHYREVIRIDPENAKAYYDLGVAYSEQGNTKEATYHFRAALKINPDYEKARIHLKQVKAGSHGSMTTRGQSDARDDLALGNRLAREGHLEEAMAHFSQALQTDPDSADVHLSIGNVRLLKGKTNDAIASYTKAIAIRPGMIEAHLSLANAYAQKARTKEVVEHSRQALHIDPDNADAHMFLANALAAEGRITEAIEHYTSALEIRPDDADALAKLARLRRKEASND